ALRGHGPPGLLDVDQPRGSPRKHRARRTFYFNVAARRRGMHRAQNLMHENLAAGRLKPGFAAGALHSNHTRTRIAFHWPTDGAYQNIAAASSQLSPAF